MNDENTIKTVDFNVFRNMRKDNTLTIRDAAKRAGISTTYLWQIETGQRKPSAEIMKKIAPVYGSTAQALLQVTGYFEEPQKEVIDSERIQAAFKLVETDKDYNFGTYMSGEELSLEAKRYIVEVYQKTTNRKLL